MQGRQIVIFHTNVTFKQRSERNRYLKHVFRKQYFIPPTVVTNIKSLQAHFFIFTLKGTHIQRFWEKHRGIYFRTGRQPNRKGDQRQRNNEEGTGIIQGGKDSEGLQDNLHFDFQQYGRTYNYKRLKKLQEIQNQKKTQKYHLAYIDEYA